MMTAGGTVDSPTSTWNRKLQPLLPAWTPTILTWELIWTQLISQTLYFRLSLTIFTSFTILTIFTFSLCFASPWMGNTRDLIWTTYLTFKSISTKSTLSLIPQYWTFKYVATVMKHFWNIWICCFTAAAFLFIRMDPTAGELEPFWSRRGKCSRVIKRLDPFSRHIASHRFVRFLN